MGRLGGWLGNKSERVVAIGVCGGVSMGVFGGNFLWGTCGWKIGVGLILY